MDKIKDSFVKPRDVSGPRSSNRFDYQKDWAILKMMEMYEIEEDFLLIMDYYDDVVIYDSATDPENISFFQIKTSSKNWTLKSLTNRKEGKKGPSLSILGKMYECKMQFPEHTLSLNFISNYTYNLKLLNGGRSIEKKRICLSELEQDSISEIIHKVMEEHQLEDDPDFIELTFFEVSDLLINNRETYLKGKISEFIEKQNPDIKYKVSVIYDALFSEVKVKNNYENDISSFEELAKRKGISREQFKEHIQVFSLDDEDQKLWEFISDSLIKEKIPFSDRLKIKQEWDKFRIDKMNYANLKLKEIIDEISKMVQPYKGKQIISLQEDLLKPVFNDYISRNTRSFYNEFYIKVIILMEFSK
ncbi:uncharacterized protein DUF4297 [Salinicoccus kekensis]|uniref:Uncharacterized protein DUF4297 n=2 Tax=Salinicoccus kekensis TaxID=714307 RepID=A0A285UG57_9STAP|nr:uncharacterized protein DUF4297 [Salinicoccus kekensis]